MTSASQVIADVRKVLHHFDEAEVILNRKILQVERQIRWIKDHIDPDSLSEDALVLVTYLENKQKLLVDKLTQTKNISASLADYFYPH